MATAIDDADFRCAYRRVRRASLAAAPGVLALVAVSLAWSPRLPFADRGSATPPAMVRAALARSVRRRPRTGVTDKGLSRVLPRPVGVGPASEIVPIPASNRFHAARRRTQARGRSPRGHKKEN